MKKLLYILFPLVFLLGCEGKIAELVEKTNTWEFSEQQDKIANK